MCLGMIPHSPQLRLAVIAVSGIGTVVWMCRHMRRAHSALTWLSHRQTQVDLSVFILLAVASIKTHPPPTHPPTLLKGRARYHQGALSWLCLTCSSSYFNDNS